MNTSDDEYDTDDDFNEDEDTSLESRVWQLLLLINPGDEDMALQQFDAYRDAMADDEEAEPLDVIGRVVDWRSGFYVDVDDTHALVQAVNELSARWNVQVDWNGDPDEDDFHDDNDVPSLFAVAYDRLAEHGYTLWAWETEDDRYAGWITQTRDNEPMREVATVLGVNLRLGSEVS
jgi:hypothetical protein